MSETVLVARNVVQAIDDGKLNINPYLKKHTDSGKEKSIFPLSNKDALGIKGASLYIGNVKKSNITIIYFRHEMDHRFVDQDGIAHRLEERRYLTLSESTWGKLP